MVLNTLASPACLLLLFCGLAYSCGSAEYEIYGECCPMCTPGTRVYKHCTEYTSTSCVPCTQKSFIDVPNGLAHCLSCTVCDPDLGLKTERECTPTSDTVCGPLDHHYCTKTDNKGCSFAQKHTICRPGQFIIHKGTTLTNTECGYCPDKTFSNEDFSAYCKPHTDCQSLGLQEMTAGTNTLDNECGPGNIPVSIFIVTVLLVLVSVVILTVIFILKRRKKNVATDLTEGERMNSVSQPQDEGWQDLLFDRVRSSAIREDIKVDPLLPCIERSQLRWFRHLIRMPPVRLPLEVFRGQPLGRRPRGRPGTRWRDIQRLAWYCLGIH
ncbi:tumor necrosis factor receptor superfamily member 14-like isoform X2 [Anguilla anguilla]|uniref:tumor necrosis factor receptor superfamily member 14-like isoform X2 n=1 Tax=Anguilla anguilla TaxID=7936 RepID=UPI0015B0F858|nr:tumor necrosis factor receptor superfamily member 14-like isoform X2 [Anguilla anguilla]XP_035237191.1 tumor necrosis factor receptor superfamily member 14-like isoform X2 [Anguilla anguilla]XP_035237192.1 tumor necrosis factor receptor superfamily member 14-like isoform X2 [Anguilla anguilla]